MPSLLAATARVGELDQFSKVPHEYDEKLEGHVTCEWAAVTSLNE